MKNVMLLLSVVLMSCRTAPEPAQKKEPVEVPTTNYTMAEFCEQGNPGSCLELGARFERGEEVNRDVDKAYDYYEQACKLGSSHGCYAKALVLLNERDNPIQALSFLEYGCDQAKHGPSCVALGDLSRDGAIFPRNEVDALKRYGQACESGYHVGCNAYIRQVWTASKQLVGLSDFTSFLQTNCDAGHEMSCREVAKIYQNGEQWAGDAVAANPAEAAKWRGKIARARRMNIHVDEQVAPPPQEMAVRDVTPKSDPPPFEAGYVVVSGGEGRSIVVDGVDSGKVSPATVTLFTGGRHVVQLRGKDGQKREKHVWIDSGARVELVFD